MEKQSVGFQPFSQSGTGDDGEPRAEVPLLLIPVVVLYCISSTLDVELVNNYIV